MSLVLSTMMFRRGTVRHLAKRRVSPIRTNDNFVTLCGIDTIKRQYANVDGMRTHFGYNLCKTCAKVLRLNDADRVLPERDGATTRRAETMGAPVQEVPGRIFRVQGHTDTYTVTVPDNDHLATLCNCMAGKVHPEKECKHAATVRITTGATT